MINAKNFGLKLSAESLSSKTKKGNTPLTPNQSHTTPSSSSSSSNSTLDHFDLALQFSVFSPSFMFTLKPSNYFRRRRLPSPFSTSSTSSESSSPPLSPQPTSTTNCLNLLVTSNPLSPSQAQSNNHRQFLDTTTAATTSTSPLLTTTHERHIKILAKSLQTLANMTECKEPYMMPLSEFLNLNKPNVIKFIEEISSDDGTKINFSNENEDEAIRIKFEQASCKHLAILHRILNSFLPQIKAHIENVLMDSVEVKHEDDDEDCFNSRQKEINFAQSMQRLVFILDEINVKMTQ
jgi:hypothetical protein